MANVATDVNHHYMSRILLPSIAAGIGKAGDLYADANTEILTNGYSIGNQPCRDAGWRGGGRRGGRGRRVQCR